MGKIFGFFTILIIIVYLISCTGVPLRPSSTTTTGPRTIIIGNEIISEENAGGFISWFCYDFVHEEKGILLEAGYFGDSDWENIGYVLYDDGGYTGKFTHYQRNGLEHGWDWPYYAFVIKSDGTGLYYDFSNTKKGESKKASAVFKCYKK